MTRATTIMTDNLILERLDQIDYAFRTTSNREQAVKEERQLLGQFVRASAQSGGVREPRKCAQALIQGIRYIAI